MKAGVTKYERELVELAERFLDAARDNAESCAILERYGYDRREHERGLLLVRGVLRSFRWEQDGKAWNFLSPTPERRILEAREWHRTTRRRHMQKCFRRAEEAAGWIGAGQASKWPTWRKLTLGTLAGVRHALAAVAPRTWVDHRLELRRNVKRARGPRPTGAPPPKDAALVELAGWYERWSLVAIACSDSVRISWHPTASRLGKPHRGCVERAQRSMARRPLGRFQDPLLLTRRQTPVTTNPSVAAPSTSPIDASDCPWSASWFRSAMSPSAGYTGGNVSGVKAANVTRPTCCSTSPEGEWKGGKSWMPVA